MTSLAEAFGLGRGCFGREGVLRCTGTFPETGGALAAGDLAVVDLLFTEGVEELARAPALGLSLLGERLPVAAKAGEFQLLEQQRQGRFHRS